MKITIIASDENTAPLYRVRLLAKMLSRRYEVETLGFAFDRTKLDPGAPRDFDYTPVYVDGGRSFAEAEQELRSLITGDVLYAMKPRPTSLGVALRHRAATGTPVAVDIDDWELSMVAPWSKYVLKNMAYALPRLQEPNNYMATWLLDKRIRQADAATVVSTFFQQKYGGVMSAQYVDTELFDPTRFDRGALRRQFGLDDYRLVVFAGIAHPGKGVGDVVTALKALGDARRDWRLVIVGPVTPYAKALAEADDRVVLLGTQPPTETPRFLAMADLVVLPQRPAHTAVGQMPMKLYEAMAMGLPVVSTAMSDIPRLLEGCGRVVAPADPVALAEAVRGLLDDPAEAARLGAAARRKIVTQYAWEVGAREMGAVLEGLVADRAAVRAAA